MATPQSAHDRGPDVVPDAPGGQLGVADYFASVFALTLDDIHWGDLHNHSYYSQDAQAQKLTAGAADVVDPGVIYGRARDLGFRFSAVVDHAEAPVAAEVRDGTANVWASSRAMARLADDATDGADGIFVPFVGYEYTNPNPAGESQSAYGHKNVVFRDVEEAPLRRLSQQEPAVLAAQCADDAASNYCGFEQYSQWAPDNVALWDGLRAQGMGPSVADGVPGALTIVHTPATAQRTDWEFIDADFVRLVEIFSQQGNEEGPPPEGCANQHDIVVTTPENLIIALSPERTLRQQIQARWIEGGDGRYRFGFAGGSDNHAGLPGGEGNGYDGGITGAVTARSSREGIFRALSMRHTLAATWYKSMGPIPVLFSVETGGKAYLSGHHGTLGDDGRAVIRVLARNPSTLPSGLVQMQLVVDGCTTQTLSGIEHEVVVEGLDPLERHYLYVRVRLPAPFESNEDGQSLALTLFNQTWASPVYLSPTSSQRE